jgi:WD40 repeat protein
MHIKTNIKRFLIFILATIRSPIKRFEGHQDTLIAAEWFPDGELIATGSWDRSANIYNVETGKMLCNLQHDDYLTNVNIHNTHKIILTSSKDCTFKIWDFRDPICSVNVYQGHSRSVNSAVFVNEDKIATSSDDQTLKLWDLRIMRSPLFTINVNSGVNRICTMTTDDTYICLPLDNRDIKVYNLQGERVLRLPRTNRIGHKRLVTSLASCGNLLVSASFDKQINCWSFDSNSQTAKSSKMIHNKENDQLEHQLFSSPTTPVSASNNGLIMNSNTSPLSVYKPQSTVPTLAMTNLTNNGNSNNNVNMSSGTTASKGLNNTLSKFIKI